MAATKHWSVDIYIDEHDGKTRAEARLETGIPRPLTAVGRASLNPSDEDVPEIGDELAVARALVDLGHRLLISAAADIEDITHEKARLT